MVWPPKDATADENVKIMHTLVVCDRRQDLWSIASEVSISYGTVQSIQTNILSARRFKQDGCHECCPMVRNDSLRYF